MERSVEAHGQDRCRYQRRQSGVDCAILVHPTAASSYKRRTGREITDWDSSLDHSFDEADYKLELIRPDEMKFAKKGSYTVPEEMRHA